MYIEDYKSNENFKCLSKKQTTFKNARKVVPSCLDRWWFNDSKQIEKYCIYDWRRYNEFFLTIFLTLLTRNINSDIFGHTGLDTQKSSAVLKQESTPKVTFNVQNGINSYYLFSGFFALISITFDWLSININWVKKWVRMQAAIKNNLDKRVPFCL